MPDATIVATYSDITGTNTSIAVPNVQVGDWIIVSLQAIYTDAANMGLTNSGSEAFVNLAAPVGKITAPEYYNVGFRNAYFIATGAGTRTITQTGGSSNDENIMHVIHARGVVGLTGTPVLQPKSQNDTYADAGTFTIPDITTTQPNATVIYTYGLVQFGGANAWGHPAGSTEMLDTMDNAGYGSMGVARLSVPTAATISGKSATHIVVTSGGAGAAAGVFAIYGAADGAPDQTLTAVGYAVPVAFGTPTWSQGVPDQTLAAIGYAVPIAFGTPVLLPQQIIAPPGYAAPVAFGTPTFKYKQFLNPVGYAVPIAFGTIVTFEPEGVQLLPDVFGDTGRLKVEFAWGADLQGDPELWEWDDVTSDVRIDPPIQIHIGQNDESPIPNPAQATFVLKNSSGRYWIDGRSPLWPHVRRNTPTRVSLSPGGSVGFTTLFQGYADGFTPSFEPSLNTEIFNVSVSASGVLRRIEQGFNSLISPYRRAMTALDSVIAYWPFEDGENAQQAENVIGGQPARFTGIPKFAANEDFESSAPMLDLNTAYFAARVDPYPSTGINQVRWLMSIPENGLDTGTDIFHIHFPEATLYRFDIIYEIVGTTPILAFYAYDLSGNLIRRDEVAFTLDGTQRRWTADFMQNGSALQIRVGSIPTNATGEGNTEWYYLDYTNRTTTYVSAIDINSDSVTPAKGLGFGHLTIQSGLTGMYEAFGPLSAFIGEKTWVRYERLCAENGIASLVYGDDSAFGYQDEMGPQIRGSLRELLETCAISDDGIIFDGLSNGLTFITRRNIERVFTSTTPIISLSDAQVPLEIFDDDALSQNRITVKIEAQSSATLEDGASIEDIGLYDKSLTVYNRYDPVAAMRAEWELHKGRGAQGRYRIPTIIIDFRDSPELAPSMLLTQPGRRIMFDGQFFTVRGYTHTITPAVWTMELLCMPYVHNVAQVAQDGNSDDVWQARVETDGCELLGAHTIGDTTLNVSSDWTTDPDDYPFLVSVGGNTYVALSFAAGVMTIQNGLNTDKPAGTPVSLWNNQGVLGL